MTSSGDRRRWWIAAVAIPLLAMLLGTLLGPLAKPLLQAIPVARDLLAEPDPAFLYSADWSKGLDGWRADTGTWEVADGSLMNYTVFSEPCEDPGEAVGRIVVPRPPGTADYSVEARIGILRCLLSDPTADYNFGIAVRTGYYVLVGVVLGRSGVHLAVDHPTQGRILETYPVPLDNLDWSRTHVLRVDVKGNRLAVFFDGSAVITVDDPTYPAGGEVALVYQSMLVTVSEFRITLT